MAALEKANMKDKPTLETRKQNNSENLSCINHNPVLYKFVRESKRLKGKIMTLGMRHFINSICQGQPQKTFYKRPR